MRFQGLLPSALLVAVCSSVVGCQPQGPVRAALKEDLPSLRAEILAAEARGKLDRKSVLSVAEAVAQREAASANGPTGVEHVHALRGCAKPLLGVLRSLSERHDEVGAEALLARIQQGDVQLASLTKYANDADPAFRAVAARGLIRAADGPARRRSFTDPDQRVRRAALEAARVAHDAYDLEGLLEVVRLDPDSLSRSWAARAIGAIGGEQAVLGLKDRYERADAVTKLAILEAWAAPATLATGGERELARIAAQPSGIAALTAAQLLRTQPLSKDRARDGAWSTRIRVGIENGTSDEKRVAIGFAELSDPATVKAVEAAARDLDSSVQLTALRRLTELPATRNAAFARLRSLAQGKTPEAAEVQLTLAELGERSVLPVIEQTLERGPSTLRSRAALALFGIGREARAARALADADPSVRISVSCGMLARSR
ncbi:MAG TPA: hypothetical protein VFQ61_10910 [Polyangiaceae bacterium]|nr:hypothetical protein [Polyangiaceae bacterium]